MAKIQLATPARETERLLQFLQEEAVIHLAETPLRNPKKKEDNPEESPSTQYRLARVQFVLELITRLRMELRQVPKRNWRNLFAGKPTASLEDLEETYQRLSIDDLIAETERINELLTESQAEIDRLKNQIELFEPWVNVSVTGKDLHIDGPYIHQFLVIKTRDQAKLREQLASIPTGVWQEVKRISEKQVTTVFGEIIAHEADQERLQEFIRETDAEIVSLPLTEHQTIAEAHKELADELATQKETYQAALKEGSSLFEKEQDIKYAYDALLHLDERERSEKSIAKFEHVTVITGWVPKAWKPRLEKRLQKHFEVIALEEIEPEEDEQPPVALHNNKLVQPFESVTNIYGKPAYNEMDPTGPLSIFFLIAFGLALTDAGYGIVMMIITFLAQKLLRLPTETKQLVRLLFFAGLFTTVIGALTGGWFGVTLEEMPVNTLTSALLSIKLIDPVSDPITLLMVAFAVGIAQLLFARAVSGYYHWNNGEKGKTVLDDIPWITMVVVVLLWAGTLLEVINPSLQEPFKWAMYANALFLVATQGREHKNPLLKLGAGILSLYGLVGFLSDTLSYSRLLALGLATAIIGLVVNLIASMVAPIPVVGLLLAIVVLIGGHIFNLGINTLGAFIHSGRLQFVEFFPKFMEGGGVAYRPFGRVSKYVADPKEFT